MPELPQRQRLFVAEYLKDLNATQAAIRAGYSGKTAVVQGPRLLGNVRIATAIAEAMDARAARIEVKADDVLRELLLIARSDIGQAFDTSGKLKALHEIPEDTRRAISGIETDELFEHTGDGERAQTGWVRKVKFWDKVKGLELLGKHLKLWTDKVEATGPEGRAFTIQVVTYGKEEE